MTNGKNHTCEKDHDIDEIINYYDLNWSDEKKRNTNIGWGYEQRRIHSTIFDFLNIKENDLVLEIGCGKGDLTEKLSAHYRKYTAFDISSMGVKKTRERIHVNCNSEIFVGDATKIPFNANQFDVVIFSEVLEHIINQEMCMHEIYRVLKPNGLLILTTPNSGGIYRFTQKLLCYLRKVPFKYSSQIIDNPLSSSELEQLLVPYFSIKKKKGLVYTLSFLQILNSRHLINLANRISEFIECANLLPNSGLYQCISCVPCKSIDNPHNTNNINCNDNGDSCVSQT